ncbi:hypothetical protein BRADI_3g04096v3 [Brachypodium distachyon]|nr:hypothetical protein BRADI_3g04096v3 [Brachypodium distachyon]
MHRRLLARAAAGRPSPLLAPVRRVRPRAAGRRYPGSSAMARGDGLRSPRWASAVVVSSRRMSSGMADEGWPRIPDADGRVRL